MIFVTEHVAMIQDCNTAPNNLKIRLPSQGAYECEDVPDAPDLPHVAAWDHPRSSPPFQR